MDEQKFEFMVGELEDEVEFNKLYNYKKFRQLTLTYNLTKAETNELKNHFNWIARDRRERHKERFEWLKDWWRDENGGRLSKETKNRLYHQAWSSI
jgi:hypothetical protein